jgi:SNF2 family DNA or RNA helicase
LTSTSTTTTTTMTTTTASQPLGEGEQMEEAEMEVPAVRKRLRKRIREEPADSDAVDFKPTVNLVDESDAFSSQGPEFSLSQSYELHEISDEEMEEEVDLSSQVEEMALPPDYTFPSGLKLSPLWRSMFLLIFLYVQFLGQIFTFVLDRVNMQLRDYQHEGVKFIWQTLQNPQYMGAILCDQMGLGKTGMYLSL